jgi:aminoglycoside phosphotransferase (APT) family kinase protein
VFRSTRIDPYFDATAAMHPSAASRIGWLADTMVRSEVAVIHGDISPKNILVGSRLPVILDAECACVGDPAFDAAFLLTHLCLKCVWRPEFAVGYFGCAEVFLERYLASVDWEGGDGIDSRISALLALLLLARIDGKVPVEYIRDDATRNIVRDFALHMLRTPLPTTRQTMSRWQAHLSAMGWLAEPARQAMTYRQMM